METGSLDSTSGLREFWRSARTLRLSESSIMENQGMEAEKAVTQVCTNRLCVCVCAPAGSGC